MAKDYATRTYTSIDMIRILCLAKRHPNLTPTDLMVKFYGSNVVERVTEAEIEYIRKNLIRKPEPVS